MIQLLTTRRQNLLPLYFVIIYFLSFSRVIAQTDCASVAASQIIATPATCPGNGSITVPTVNGGIFRLEGPGISGFIQQDSPVFESLSAGTFTAKLYCNGQTTPTSFQVVVENKYAQLTLVLNGNMPCPNQGKIEAIASKGYNLGGTGVQYQYAIWTNSQGGPGRSDGELTYVNTNSFSGLAEGIYNVRVKDNCNNFTTSTITIAPISPVGRVVPSMSWKCTATGFTLDGTGSLRLITGNTTLNPTTYSGYTYSVYTLGVADDCATSTGTLIGNENTPIINSASMSFSLPPTTIRYKIVTTSPCGDKNEICYNAPANPTLSFRATLTPNCSANGKARLIIFPATQNYSYVSTNRIIEISSAIVVGGVPFTTIVRDGTNSSNIFTNLDPAYSPYKVKLTDLCLATEQTLDFGTAAKVAPKLISPSYTRTCSDIGSTNVTFEIEGWAYGLENQTTTYQLINTSTNSVVQTVTGLTTSATNRVTFTNVPADQTYKVIITPSSTGTGNCSATTTNTITIPASQGFNFSVASTTLLNCAGGNSVTITATENDSRSPTYSVTGPNNFSSSSNTLANLAPGNYTYTATLSSGSCTLMRNGSFIIGPGNLPPSVTKVVAINCQNIGEDPQTIGSAYIAFEGNGPFKVEYKKVNETNYTAIPGTFVSEYTFTNLNAGVRYQFRIIDQCGVSATQEASIKPLKPNIITNTLQPCINSPYTLSAQTFDDPSATYTWTKLDDLTFSAGGKDIVFNSYTPTNDGTYRLKITLLNGCVVRENFVTLNSEDCGNPFPLGSIGNFVWYDTNKNGIQDAGEIGAEGLKVDLEIYVGSTGGDFTNENNWTFQATTTTDPDGEYLFDLLPSGIYRVKFSPAINYEFTLASEGSDTSMDSDASKTSGLSAPITIDVSLPINDIGRNNMTIDAGLVIKDTGLPVKLIDFTIRKEAEAAALLTWSTSEEVNSDYFQIERSADSKNWLSIGKVDSFSNSSVIRNYQFTDSEPIIGTSYYRLKMIDLDDTFAYSRIENISFDNGAKLVIYPNPVKNHIYLKTSEVINSIELFNNAGISMLRSTNVDANQNLDLPSLPMGTYVLTIKYKNGKAENRKIVISN